MSSTTSTTSEKPSEIREGAVLGGKYVIQQLIGSGGMGRVYTAIQKPFNRQLVIKVMHKRQADHQVLVQRFFQEARAISRLSHPNTVTVFDFGQTDAGTLYIVMEYVEGVPLGEMIRETGALRIEEAVSFAAQIAQALGEAHHVGIVHRDLKPDNVMVVRSSGTEPFVKVLDFGIAKMVDEGDDLTEAGNIVGTPAYMAPEQARSEEVDGRTDLYALGCCLYEMLTGRRPYQKDTPVAVLLSHQNEPVPSLPERFPDRLDAFVKSAMAKDPEERPADASAFVARLMSCFMGNPQEADELESGSSTMRLEERMRMLGTQTPQPSNLNRFSRSRTVTNSSAPSQPGGHVGDSGGVAADGPGEETTGDQFGTFEETPPAPGEPATSDGGARMDSGTDTVSSDPSAVAPEYFDTTETGRPGTTGNRRPRRRSVSASGRQRPEKLEGGGGDSDESSDRRGHQDAGTESTSSEAGGSHSERTGETGADDGVATGSPGDDGAKRWWKPVAPAAVLAAGAVIVAALVVGGGDGDPEPLELTSDPEVATVYIDDIPVGTTPLTHETSEETIGEIRFDAEGFDPVTFEDFDVATGGDNRLYAELEPASMKLRVDAGVTGAEIRVDDRRLGTVEGEEPAEFTVEWPRDGLEVVARDDEDDVARRVVDPVEFDDTVDVFFDRDDFQPPDEVD